MKKYKKLNRFNYDVEILQEQAKENGFDKITDELIIAEAKYQYLGAKDRMYYSILFDDSVNKNDDEYKDLLKDYKQLERFYYSYCR